METESYTNNSHLGRKIERIRRLRGMTQTDLGELLGVTKQAISKMEQSEKIDDDKLKQVADALGVTEDGLKKFTDCGHYKGIDYRIREHLITKEISVGDYVLTGGELAAAIITDAVVRLIPGAIGDEQSALSDSFQDDLLAPPVYTRPADYKGWKVPEVLLSGHQRKIEEWRLQQAQERTARLRPDLLK